MGSGAFDLLIAWEMDVRTRRFVRVSGEAESVLGYPEKRWREAPGFWIGVLHPEDRERVAQAVWRAVRQGGSCEIEYRVVAADGAVVRLRDRVRLVPGVGGEASVLQGATVDVSPESGPTPEADDAMPRRWRRSRRSNHVLSPPATASADRPVVPLVRTTAVDAPASERAPAFACDRLLDQLGEAVIASDAAHRIVYWNAAAELLLGWPAQEVVGKTDSEFLQAKTSAGQTAEIIAGLLRNRPWSAEVQVRRRDRSTLPARITASALRGSDGAVAGYVAVVTDLRAVRERASRREAMAAMDAVAGMARGIARELNEAVSRIEAGIRSTLARVSLQERSRAQLDDALRTIDATAALAAQLLAVGRDMVIKPARTDLAAVVHSSHAALSLLCGTDIMVEMELDPATLPAWADSSIASQVMLNLAANACGAMPEGGRLIISTTNADLSRGDEDRSDVPFGQWVVLEVRDTRSEVPRLDRIFEPYAEGIVPPGMGLAAAYGMMALSGGRLTAEASATEGVVFRAYFRPALTGQGTERKS